MKYEVYKNADTVECVEFDEWEAAEEYTNANGCGLICEIGGSWDEYEKCWFCENWYPRNELDRDGLCDRCEMAAINHGFDPDTRPRRRDY